MLSITYLTQKEYSLGDEGLEAWTKADQWSHQSSVPGCSCLTNHQNGPAWTEEIPPTVPVPSSQHASLVTRWPVL